MTLREKRKIDLYFSYCALVILQFGLLYLAIINIKSDIVPYLILMIMTIIILIGYFVTQEIYKFKQEDV